MSRPKTNKTRFAVVAVGLIAIGASVAYFARTSETPPGQWWASLTGSEAAQAGQSSPSTAGPGAPAQRPNAFPGEPGVVDVQHWDWLQQDLERLVERTRPRAKTKRIGPDEFRARFVDATVEYLGLDATDRERFEQAVGKSLDELGGAREDMDHVQGEGLWDEEDQSSIVEHKAAWEEYSERQRHAVRHLLAALDDRPRHSMLREDAHKWMLRLDYGVRAAGRRTQPR